MLKVMLRYEPWKKSQRILVARTMEFLGEKSPAPIEQSATLKCLQLLLRTGVDIDSVGMRGMTILCVAITNNAPIEYVSHLIHLGASVDPVPSLAWLQFPLAMCALFDRADIAALFLGNGANLNTRDLIGDAAIRYMISVGAPKCLNLLLSAGVDCTQEGLIREKPSCIELLNLIVSKCWRF